MNRLLRPVLQLFAAPHLDMRRDYPRVRRLQRGLAASPTARFRALDLRIGDADGSREVPVRVFRPRSVHREDVLLFFHGGGWVTGDISSYTPACATMAEQTGCVVASVDYRLAPEHPFPAGLEDCWRVARAILEEPWRLGASHLEDIVLIGDSAGGNLAAAVSLLLRDLGGVAARRQILLYPVTGSDHDPATSPYRSVREHGTGLRLTSAEMQDYVELYLPDEALREDPMVAPIRADDLAHQPKTLIITAELDLLCDEGEAYGEALAAAGNAVRVHRVDGALHGFITLPRFARPVREAYGVIDAFLAEGPP
ncbi:alpha/beta hydrolase [Brachybacterium hainanense]|uniref:Alpha/beta hydrolase n=1 Tax=Brachybacterium hainanense TaxID=1541174 RepID=A0ABV6RA45_9MICO